MAQRSLYAGSVRSRRIIRDAQNADDGRGGWGYVGAPDRIPERSGQARQLGIEDRRNEAGEKASACYAFQPASCLLFRMKLMKSRVQVAATTTSSASKTSVAIRE